MKLRLEILNGPLDGAQVTLENETLWAKTGEGSLIFPWDTQLGTPQARFFFQNGKWWIEGYAASHKTYSANREQSIVGKFPLEEGELLQASDTWLLVGDFE